MRPVPRLAASLFAAALALAAAAQIAAACPSYNDPAVFGSANIPANFTADPYLRNLTAGGRVSLQSCGFDCPGYTVSRPDSRFFYSGVSPTGRLTIAPEAISNVDTVPLVNAPGGSWHDNDDYRGTDSAITFPNPLQGRYDVWTGSDTPSSNNPARLVITELND